MISFKRASLYLTPILIIATIATVWTQILKPAALNLISKQIPKLNSSQNYVQIQIEDFDISLFKLQLIANNVQVNFNQTTQLSPFKATHLTAQLDLFDLIVGQINIAKIIIDNADWDYAIKITDSDKKPKIPTDLIFKYLNTIPIDHIILNNSTLKLTLDTPQTEIRLNIPHAAVSNRRKELNLSFNNLNSNIIQANQSGFDINSNLDISLNKDEINLNKFELQSFNSDIVLSGRFQNVENLLIEPNGKTQISGKIDLQDARTLALLLAPQKKRLAAISGIININGSANLDTLDKINGSLDINTTQVIIEQFKLGQAHIRASISNSELNISEVKLEHPAGNALIKNLKLDKNPPYRFSSSVEIINFDLQKLFNSIGLSNIPTNLGANGSATCHGALRGSTLATCNVHTTVENLWVKPDKNNNFHIVKIKQIQLNGEAKFSHDDFSYNTNIQIGPSKGTSSGIVSFNEGFDINFDTDDLDFDYVESLADLDFKGHLKIKGNTKGDASSGVINAFVAMEDSEISKFRLGQLSANLDYKKSHLNFTHLAANIGKSNINGFINFDFSDSTLEGNLNSTKLNAEDVFYSLSKKFSLPFDLTGSGKANILFNGPYNFWKLKYDLDSEFINGAIAKEKFSRLSLNLTSNGDTILFRKVSLRKTKSLANFEGTINTIPVTPEFRLKVKINPFLLEEIDHVITYAPALSGVGYSEGHISGPINSPDIIADFTLKQVSYDKVDYPNSQGRVSIDKNYFNFNGQFFGRQIQSNLIWPWNPNDSFSAKILVNELNPLFLLPLISLPQPSSDYSAKLNGEVDIISKNRSLSSAEGHIKISDFFISRGSQFLKLKKPSRITFKSGLSEMDNILLEGNDNFIKVELNQASNQNIKLTTIANLQLRLFQFLVPFAQSLAGNLAINSQIQIKTNSFDLLGEGELTDGYVIMKGFPQPIESINIPIEFSKSKIFFSDITGKLGQSDVTGIGQIEILEPKNIQVNLKAIADNVEINFPDKIITGGKANLLFSGNWLPYNLKIDYKVTHGLVEKDFEAEAGQSMTLRASPYLPLQQIEELSPSLDLNINVDLSKGIIIKNKIIEGEAFGLLNITGSPESPSLKGKIDIKPGSKLIFKDKPFAVQTAQINFQTANEINPDLYISANSRISDYDINLLVQGPAKSPIIKPSSQPPLTESDIFSLLALGVTSQSDSNLSSETQQKQTGLEVLAAISNQSQLNKKIQDKLGLTLQLAPSVDSTKNIAVPKVVVSKKLSDKLNASYSKPFTGNDQNQEIKLQYLYNNNVSVLLNYQNKDTTQEEQITNTNTNTKGIWGFDLEYRDEFK